jgi:hypothetical protein
VAVALVLVAAPLPGQLVEAPAGRISCAIDRDARSGDCSQISDERSPIFCAAPFRPSWWASC